MALTSATVAEFDAFTALMEYGAVPNQSQVLARAHAFMQSLPWCDANQVTTDNIKSAQMHVAYALTQGSFDPFTPQDNRILIKEEIGRDAIVDEYKVNETVASLGTDSYSQLKRLPIPFGLVQSLLCPSTDVLDATTTTHQASGFVV